VFYPKNMARNHIEKVIAEIARAYRGLRLGSLEVHSLKPVDADPYRYVEEVENELRQINQNAADLNPPKGASRSIHCNKTKL